MYIFSNFRPHTPVGSTIHSHPVPPGPSDTPAELLGRCAALYAATRPTRPLCGRLPSKYFLQNSYICPIFCFNIPIFSPYFVIPFSHISHILLTNSSMTPEVGILNPMSWDFLGRYLQNMQ